MFKLSLGLSEVNSKLFFYLYKIMSLYCTHTVNIANGLKNAIRSLKQSSRNDNTVP